MRLRLEDIPGFTDRAESKNAVEESDSWTWWRRSDRTGEYMGLDVCLDTLAELVREAQQTAGGFIDGVIGFSQGGAAAGMLASLLCRRMVESRIQKDSCGQDIHR
jgi:hypothetical protein